MTQREYDEWAAHLRATYGIAAPMADEDEQDGE